MAPVSLRLDLADSKARYDPPLGRRLRLQFRLRGANIVFAFGLDHKIWCAKA